MAESASGLPGIVVIALGYLFLFWGGLIIWGIEKVSSSGGHQFILFHGRQGMILGATWFVCVIIPLIILDAILGATVHVGGFFWMFGFLGYLVLALVITIKSAPAAKSGHLEWELPWLGKYAKRGTYSSV
ncbi:hypothetical protein QOT17_016824 [Balamuthia mandrillaris]